MSLSALKRLANLALIIALAPLALAHAQAPAGGQPPARLRAALAPLPGDTATAPIDLSAYPKPSPLASSIPDQFLLAYQLAGRRFGVDWRLLAAIGRNESNHGQSSLAGVHSGVNGYGCCAGPMQINVTDGTWQGVATDGDSDGFASPYDPYDAAASAALYIVRAERSVGSSPALLLAAYNAGIRQVLQFKGVPPYRETRLYVEAGLRYIAGLRPEADLVTRDM